MSLIIEKQLSKFSNFQILTTDSLQVFTQKKMNVIEATNKLLPMLKGTTTDKVPLGGSFKYVEDKEQHYSFEYVAIGKAHNITPIHMLDRSYMNTTKEKLNNPLRGFHANPVARVINSGMVQSSLPTLASRVRPNNPIELSEYKMINRLIFVVFFCINVLSLSAQSVISGWVSDKADKKPIGGVVITLLDAEEETIAYSITKSDGSFSITLNSHLPKLTLHARLLGYEEQRCSIENKTQTISLEMTFGEIELREVVVKSRPMWNREDTLVYSVDAFKSVGDRTIGDLLKKLPGVEVSESGGIKYQGESINKFYIEGLDLLERRYGIATNNVPVDAVQNVEVIENHQPLQALKDIVPNSNAAINLRLRKDKKMRPVGAITLGAGYADELLWLAEAFALNVGKEKQSIIMYKGNNAAKDISSELSAQTLDNLEDVSGYSQKTLFNARSFSYPPLEKKRYLLNNSHAVSVNSLWKTGENSLIRLNVQYLHDVLKENINRNSEYFLLDGTLQIKETSTLSQTANIVDAAVTYTNNNQSYYLNNTLSWSGNWDKSTSSVVMNGLGVHQYFNLPAQLLKNDLKFVKRQNKRVWDITSFVAYSSQPQRLEVSVDTLDTNQRQNVDFSGFYTRNSTYYSLGYGHSSFIVKGAAEASIDNYQSQLSHPVFIDSTNSDLASNYLLLEITPSYMYRNDKLTVNADVKLRNHSLQTKPHSSNSGKQSHHYFFADPSFRINYRFSSMLTARASYRYSHTIGDFLDFTDAYFMSAYRSFNKRSGILSQNKRQAYNIGLQYRNPLTTFFCNTSLAYAPSIRNVVGTQRFVGSELVSGSRELSTQSDMWLWMGYVGKYFPEIRTNISLNISYNSLENRRQQQGILYPYQSSGWSFMPKLNIKLSDASSISYQTIAGNQITKIIRANNTYRSSMWQVIQQLSAFFLIGDKWQLDGRAEHSFNEIGDNNSVKAFFADLGITYKHAQMELNLSANNLFNQNSYSYSTHYGLDRFDYEYKLRPRMLMLSVSFKY